MAQAILYSCMFFLNTSQPASEIKASHMDALREHLISSWSLYLTDTGGQIEFQELIPILVCGHSILVTSPPRAHCNLMKPYEVQYEYPDGRVKYLSTATLMDELLQKFATIFNSYISSDIKPGVFFVGIHIDCPPEFTAVETIQKIHEQLQRYVRQTSLSVSYTHLTLPTNREV